MSNNIKEIINTELVSVTERTEQKQNLSKINPTTVTETAVDIVRRFTNEYGLSIIKIKAEDKVPEWASWKKYQTVKLTQNEIIDNFSTENEPRIAIVCGRVSGNLELLDIDNKFNNMDELYPKFLELHGVKEVVNKCVVETSMSGGVHIYYRCTEIQGNQKLAMCPTGRIDDKGKTIYETVFETRGEGGYVVCSPSKGYVLIHGSFGEIPELTPDEREILLNGARFFNKKISEEKPYSDRKKYKTGTPWDLYNNSSEAVAECKELLKAVGWKQAGGNQNEEYWQRPGKKQGVSASYRDKSFRVFSTNAAPFENDRSYMPSSVYAILKYGEGKDNFKKAIEDFISKGFGSHSTADINRVESHLNDLYEFRYNVVTGSLEMKRRNDEIYRDVEDYDMGSIYREMQHKEINFSLDKLHTLLNSDFVQLYDPFKEYFEALPKWDGIDYIKQLSETVELTDETKRDFWYLCLRRWLIAASACAVNENVTNEVSPIFYGKQGKGKTKWFNKLIPKNIDDKKYLFVGTINDDKDSKLHLSSKFLINLDELGSLNREEIGYLKSLYSLQHLNIREPYMRKSRNLIRRASFVGSIDREEFLTDLSGTRRFLTFSVSEVDYMHSVDMDKVYSQAYTLYKSGERFYFNENEILEINENNEDFRLKPLEEELFTRCFVKPGTGDAVELLTTTEIAREIMSMDSAYKVTEASIKKIGQLLSKRDFKKKSKRNDGASVKAWQLKRVQQQIQFTYQTNKPLFQEN
jgi:hypothetical protein